MPEDRIFSEIIQLCADNGFYKRRNSFFRVHGDGVLQIVKYSRLRRPYPHVDLKIGLFSMYGEMDACLLTPSGCVTRYATHWLKPGVRKNYYYVLMTSNRSSDIEKIQCYEVDVDFTRKVVFPFLDGIQTQKQLAEAICYLDQYAYDANVHNVLWNDFTKYAPFLKSGNIEMAQKVITSILNQHESARQWRHQNWSVEQYEEYQKRTQEEEKSLNGLKVLADSADQNAINEYLDNNFKRNLKLVELFNKKAKNRTGDSFA